MATDLTGLKVKDTYNSLLKIGDNSSLSATPDKISDGLGNESILYLSTSQVSIGTLPATGYDLTVNSAIKTGSIDIVGAATAATLRLTGGSGSQGTLSWNTDEETVDIIQNGATLQVGQEVQVHVKNQTGSTITDGTPVYVTGTLGSSGRLTVAPMIADGSIEAKYFLGVTTEDIPNGEDGKVTTFGKIRGLNTSAYAPGTTLYVSSTTAGFWQTTPPVSPALDLEVAIVINQHANNGTLFVRANNGQYLGMLHDVYLNSVADNQLLVYNATNSRWENQGIASIGAINLDTVTDNGNTTTNSISVGDINAGNVTLTGYLRGAANFVIDPAAHGDETGVVQILGDLRVDGTTTTINSTTVTINDKNIVLAEGSALPGDANGAGITIDGAAASMTYNSTSDRFVFNKDIETNLVGNVTGDLTGNADTASALAASVNIEVDGAVTGNADFDGSGDITITTTVNHNHDDRYYTETESDNRFVNVAGDTMTGDLDFNDDVKAKFGTGDDLTVYHNATNSFIDNATGSILIRNLADDQDIVLASDDGAGSITDYLRVDGSEGSVKLFHYGSEKLVTTATGVSVTGAFSGNLDTSSISGSTIDINGTTRINLQYNGTTQAFVDSTGFNISGGLALTGVDGISLTDEDSTTDSYFHANVDYDAGLYTVTSNARYGADYIQVSGLDSRSNTRFTISPKDISSPDPYAYLYIGGNNSNTAPNTLVDWHTIYMNALSVRINNNEVATQSWVSTNYTLDLQDVTDNGATTTNSVYFDGDQKGLRFGTTSTVYGSVYWDATLDGVIMQQTQGTDWTRLKVGDVSTGNYKFEILGGDSSNSGEFNATGWTSLFTIDGDGHINITGNADVSGRVVADRVRINRGNKIMLEMQDSGGDYTGYLTMNDGQGNMALMLGVDGAGQYVVTSDGAAKVLYSAHGSHGAVSLNAAKTGTTATAVTFSIGLVVDANDNTIKVGNPNDDVGLLEADASGNTVFNASGDLFTTQINARTGTEVLFNDTLRIDASGVPQLILDGGSDTTGDIVVPDGEILQVGHWDSGTSTYTDRFRILANGNIGIGTTTPSQSLDVNGSVRIDDILFLDRIGGSANIKGTGEGHIVIDPLDANHNVYLSHYVAGDVILAGGGGNVGIGTTSPAQKLDVNGSVNVGSGIVLLGQNRIDGSSDNLKISADHSSVSGSSTIEFLVDGSEKMRINNSGNVGIGTTSPARRLHIADVTGGFRIEGTTGDSFTEFVTTNNHAFIGVDDSLNVLKINNTNTLGSAVHLAISTSGNVGIGTTSPSGKLHVHHNSEEVIRVDSGNTGAIHFFEGATRRGILGYSNGTSIASAADAGDMVLRVENGNKLHLGAGGAVAMTIDDSERVGIGTTSPSVKLSVDMNGDVYSADFYQSNSGTDKYNAVRIRGAMTSAVGYYGIGGSTASNTSFRDAFVVGTQSAHSLNLATSDTARMTITSAGNVGIGTTTPSAKLHVIGNITCTDQVNVSKTPSNSVGVGPCVYLIGNQGASYTILQQGVDSYKHFAFNGSSWIERMSLNNTNGDFYFNGNVGIGTTSPSYKLTVSDSNATYGIGGDSGGNVYHYSTSGEHRFRANGSTTQAFVINNNLVTTNKTAYFASNVGIGTTSPSGTLDVRPNASCNYVFTGTSTSGYTTTFNMDNTGLDIGHNSTGRSLNLRTGNADRLTITGGGNVGINTTSPAYKLHVAGEAQLGFINFEYSSNYAGVRWKNSSQNLVWKIGNDTPSGNWLYLYDYAKGASAFTFKPNSDMCFTPTGNVGIGTTSPAYNLDVTGEGRFTTNLRVGQYIYHDGDTNTSIRLLGDRIILYAGGVNMIDIVEGGTDYIDFANNTARITSGGSFETTGDIIAYTTTSLSDKNQKENIKKIDSPIDKIKQINGYTFDWKHNQASSGGVIAQEVEKVLPEIVKERSIMDSEPHKTVEYNGLIGLLIETVKEQQKQIDELKARLDGSTE